jgi:hypothetical protein
MFQLLENKKARTQGKNMTVGKTCITISLGTIEELGECRVVDVWFDQENASIKLTPSSLGAGRKVILKENRGVVTCAVITTTGIADLMPRGRYIPYGDCYMLVDRVVELKAGVSTPNKENKYTWRFEPLKNKSLGTRV